MFIIGIVQFAYDLAIATAMFVLVSAVPENDGKCEEFIKEPLKKYRY